MPGNNSHREMIIFNRMVELNRGNPLRDQIGRDATLRAGQFAPNRNGGVNWLGALATPIDGPVDGALLSYLDVLNSTPKFTAGIQAFNYHENFLRDFDTGGAQPDVNSYDGNDPA